MSLTLAKVADFKRQDYTGWLYSYKLDGYRASSYGKTSISSRTGNKFAVTPDFLATFPDNLELDGELLRPGKDFESHGALRKKHADAAVWDSVEFHVFDYITNENIPYTERLKRLKTMVSSIDSKTPIRLVDQGIIESNEHAQQLASDAIAAGKEGIMLRNPQMLYEQKRTANLAKIKVTMDAEAVVIGYIHGKGKNKLRIGSYKCEMICQDTREHTGKQFNMAGMSDELREFKNAPVIGTIVTYTYNDVTKNGIPRHPRFLRVRGDIITSSKSTHENADEHLHKRRKI